MSLIKAWLSFFVLIRSNLTWKPVFSAQMSGVSFLWCSACFSSCTSLQLKLSDHLSWIELACSSFSPCSCLSVEIMSTRLKRHGKPERRGQWTSFHGVAWIHINGAVVTAVQTTQHKTLQKWVADVKSLAHSPRLNCKCQNPFRACSPLRCPTVNRTSV